MDTFEDRLMKYDTEMDQYQRMTGNTFGELAMIHLQDMMPDEVRSRWENEKHNLLTLVDMRKLFGRMIDDHKNGAALKVKTRPLAEMGREHPDEDPEGQTEEEEAANNMWGAMMSFVRKGGGKGFNRFGKVAWGNGGGGNRQAPGGGTPGAGAPAGQQQQTGTGGGQPWKPPVGRVYG